MKKYILRVLKCLSDLGFALYNLLGKVLRIKSDNDKQEGANCLSERKDLKDEERKS